MMQKVPSSTSKKVQLARDSRGYCKASWHRHCRSRTYLIGPLPWIDLSNIHFGLEVEDHQLRMALPSAQIIAPTRTLTILPWQISTCGQTGRCLQMVIVGLASASSSKVLWVTDASPAGHEVSEFRVEAMACFAGPQAVLTLHEYCAHQGIRVLTDSKSLIQCLAQGPAWQTDTTCISIWMVLATIS